MTQESHWIWQGPRTKRKHSDDEEDEQVSYSKYYRLPSHDLERLVQEAASQGQK